MREQTPPTIFESADIAAFISIHCGINPRPILLENNRVAFAFDGDGSNAVRDFYANVPVPVADFCAKLKLIRSMIFSMRGRTYGQR